MNRKKLFIAASAALCVTLTACSMPKFLERGTVESATFTPAPTEQIVLATPTPDPTPSPTPEIDVSNIVKIVSSDSSKEAINTEKDIEEIDIPDVSYIDSFISQSDSLVSIRKIRITDTSLSLKQIEDVRSYFPSSIFIYSVDILGRIVQNNVSEIDISSGSTDDLGSVCDALKKLSAVSYVNLMKNDGTSNYAIEDVSRLYEACPGAVLNYSFNLFGKTVSTADERIEYKNQDIGNAGVDTLRSVLPFMKRCNYLLLDDCKIDYSLLAELRDEFPDTKIVWRVYFSGDGYNCLTDTEKIWATGSVTDGFTEPLKYCTEVKYMDLGHNCITHINFINYMPKLEVLVIAITWVTDISPLANCPNLEYLEVFSSNVTDISPLANCKNLKHLNISNLASVRDISCLYDLNLERLYCTMSYIPQDQQDEIARRMPDCEFVFSWTDPSKGPWRYDENGDRVPRYELLAQQFGYDNYEYSR